MKIFNLLLPLLIVTAFSFTVFIGVSEASCWLDPNGAQAGGQTCNYSLNYVPMIDLPGVTNPAAGQTSFASYVSALYSVAIVVAALLAVIRLVLAGAKYMMTDVVSGKGEAINDIKGSLLGLLIIISAFVILNTINPNLTKIVIAPDQQPGVGGAGMSGLIWISPNNNITTPGSSSASDIQNQLNNCSNLLLLPDGSRCCNDNNQCPATNSQNNTPFSGFDPSRVYTAQEIAALLQANQSVNFVDLGPSFVNYTQAQIDTQCAQAARARNTTVSSSFIINQNVANVGINTIQQRPICILN